MEWVAKVVFERIHRKFDACSFLENVRELSEDPNGLQKLQDQLLRDMKLKTKGDLRKETQVIRNRLGDKSVLIVVDDVSKTRQLENLVGKLDWFGPRIIITTNDKRLLASYQVHMGFSKKEDINLCKVKGLNNDEALQLFKQKAFHRHPSVKMIYRICAMILSIMLKAFLCFWKFWVPFCLIKQRKGNGIVRGLN